MKMKRISYLLFLPILIFSIIGVVGCSNDDDVSCITGTIYIPDQEERCVFIGDLHMPNGVDKYSYMETVVVEKDDFPLQKYQTGDVIDFNIVEVKSEYPIEIVPIGYVRHTVFCVL